MRTKFLVLSLVGLVLLGSAGVAPASPQNAPDEKLFQEAKLLIFDKNWTAALDKLQVLRDSYPKSSYAGQALFYRGECLSSLKGREKDALLAYKDFIRLPDANASLVEESEGAIIDLAFALYEKGDAASVRDIEERLGHANKAVRFYAAYKLSCASDKGVAARAVPVLRRTLETEKDPELLDRARIALLRVSPETLKSVEAPKRSSAASRMLKIRVWNKGQKEPAVSVNIPWALADLALGAMSDEDKAALRRKGYDINKIMTDLAEFKEKLIRIEDKDEIIEIWIE